MSAPKTLQFGQLQVTISESPKEVEYRFRGDVDENFRQKEFPRMKKDTIIFHLEEVKNFNSIGLREWIFLLKDIGALGNLVFRKCSVTIIDQINMVPDSLGLGTVESFFAPYYCNHCEVKAVDRLIKVADAAADISSRQAPPFNCDGCSQPLEFDALEDSYFSFADGGLPQAS